MLCAKCLQWGHHKHNFHARIIYLNCSAPGHKSFNCPARHNSSVGGNSFMTDAINDSVKSSHPGHQINPSLLAQACPSMVPRSQPPSTVRSISCGHYGHLEPHCLERRWAQRWKWKPKINSTSLVASQSPSPSTSLPNAAEHSALAAPPPKNPTTATLTTTTARRPSLLPSMAAATSVVNRTQRGGGGQQQRRRRPPRPHPGLCWNM